MTQKSENRKLIKLGEMLVLLLIIVISILFLVIYFSKNNGNTNTAKIFVNGNEYKSIKLNKDSDKKEIIEIQGDLKVEIIVQGDIIYFNTSQCPDKICINAGRLKYKHQSAACLPANVSIIIN